MASSKHFILSFTLKFTDGSVKHMPIATFADKESCDKAAVEMFDVFERHAAKVPPTIWQFLRITGIVMSRYDVPFKEGSLLVVPADIPLPPPPKAS